MKCPLFRAANITSDFDSSWSGDDCLKEECAWWDVEMGQCSINSLKSNLENIVLRLRDLVDKMPHAGQFTK